MALKRVGEACPPRPSGINAYSPLHTHRARVWAEGNGILEELQMLRARVMEGGGLLHHQQQQEHRVLQLLLPPPSTTATPNGATSTSSSLSSSGRSGGSGGPGTADPPPLVSSSAPPQPKLLVIPLTCGHNLPWMPAESALLACALREALHTLH